MDNKRQFHRAIFFTKVPLRKYYRYRDIFQIFPCDIQGMPTSSFQKHYPNFIEFYTTDKETLSIRFDELKDCPRLLAFQLKQDQILNLLNGFTNNLFFRYTNITGNWGVPMLENSSDEEINSSSSNWYINIYYSPDLQKQFKIENFSDQRLPDVEKIEHKKFYMFDPNMDYDNNKEIVFPSTIDALFDAYYSLDLETTDTINIALSYNVSAIKLKDEMKTVSLLASFTAMETMVNLEFKDLLLEKCSECGNLKYSVAKKFRAYLLKYIGDSDKNRKKFNKYYSLRSKIIHTGKQLKTENLFNGITKDERDKDLLTRIEVLQMGKLAINNWLLYRSKK